MTTRTIINRHGYQFDKATGRRYDTSSPTNWVQPFAEFDVSGGTPASDPFIDDPDNNHTETKEQ